MLDPIELRPLPEDFKLRPVQVELLSMLRESIRAGNKKVVAHLATAGGKTISAGMIFYSALQKNPTSQCWFIVNRNVLLNQTKTVFEDIFGFDCSIIQGDNTPNLSAHVQLATIQTLHNRLTSDKLDVFTAFNHAPASIVVIDECHLDFKGYKTIEKAWGPLMIGLTATPFTKAMGCFWDDMVRPKRMAELINDGTLSDYKVRACVSLDRSKLEVSSTGEYKDSDVEREANAIIGDVYREWAESEEVKNKPFLGFAKNISTCIALTDLFRSHGVNVAYVHSKMNDDLVHDTLTAFKSGHYQGVFSVVKLIEGFDFPAASVGLMCAPFAPSKHDPNIPNSCNRYVQSAGRLLRSHDTKDIAIIHDHAGNFERYGPYELIEDLFPKLDDGRGKEPKKLDPKERLERARRECSNCGMFVAGSMCPVCGHASKKPTQFLEAGDLEFIDGKMIELRKSIKEVLPIDRNKKTGWDEKIQFARELKGWCLKKKQNTPGMNDQGFYAHKYKARFGVWPNDPRVSYGRVRALEPSNGVNGWMTSQNIRFAKGKAYGQR